MKLGELIQSYRAAHNLGVRDLAKGIGVSPATLNRFERGENCDASTLAKILKWSFDQ